jgi:hypothetical protein
MVLEIARDVNKATYHEAEAKTKASMLEVKAEAKAEANGL